MKKDIPAFSGENLVEYYYIWYTIFICGILKPVRFYAAAEWQGRKYGRKKREHMKKNVILTCITIFVILAGLTTGLLIFNMTCDPEDSLHFPTRETLPPETLPAETMETTEANTEATTEPEPITGELFLTVSQITFSTVGETENIYAGTVPIDRVEWKSDDESIIHVAGGMLSAVGVGTTTITASCEGQEISCTAGCLASSVDELRTLPANDLRQPKRLVPEVPDEVLSFYDDAVLVGDNITYGFYNYKNQDGRVDNLQCLYRGSLGIHNLLTHRQNLSYQGSEMHMEDALQKLGCKKAFILLGTNDLQVRTEETVIDELDQLLSKTVEKNPDLQIYLISVLPVANRNMMSNGVNERIRSYNLLLEKYAREPSFHYVPVAPYLEDHIPGFARMYAQDKYQPNAKGVSAWIDAFRTYAYIQNLQETGK